MSQAKTKTQDYDKCIKFDIHKTLTNERALGVVNEVVNRIAGEFPKRKDTRSSLERNTATILANLVAAKLRSEYTWVAYHASNSFYGKALRSNKLNINKMTPRIIKVMHKLRLVDYQAGFRAVTNNNGSGAYKTGRVSRMRATQDLLDMLNESDVAATSIRRDFELIVLRARDSKDNEGKKIKGKMKGYSDSSRTNQMRKEMECINDYLRQQRIGLDITPDEQEELRRKLGHDIDLTCIELHRCFNDGFSRGGRLYGGWWQNIPRKYRATIVINGNKTAELDYKELHPRLAYAKLNAILPPGDMYDMPRPQSFHCKSQWRWLAKKTLNTMLNASCSRDVVLAVQRTCNQSSPKIKTDHTTIKSIMDALERKHYQIKQLFYTGAGLDFQYTDSEMAVEIMQALQAKGIPALPVHDSFVVEARHIGELHKAMENAFYKRCGYKPKIDRKF